jgi:PAS domain S-box-containing protein
MSDKKLCLAVCQNLAGEAAAILEAGEFADVEWVTLPGDCGFPQMNWDSLAQFAESQAANYAEIHLIGGGGAACLKATSPPLPPNCHLHKPESCFHLVAGEPLVKVMLQQGAYIVLPGWLARWQSYTEAWRLEPGMLCEMFDDAIKKVVLLDTGIENQSVEQLQAFAEFVKLPGEAVPVGLDLFRLWLEKIVFAWRLEDEKRRATESLAQRKQMEETLSKRATELHTVAQVSTNIATISEVGRLLQEVVDLTKSSFDLYHAHIYLLNEAGDTLNLAAGAGTVGRQMAAKGWSIPLDREHSVVAQAARSRRGVIVNDVQATPDFLPNPLLPDTRAEMAIPLLLGEHLLGVLDVQADILNRFTEEDVRIKTTLAGQVAVALENARLLERTQTTLAETQRLATIVENQPEFIAVTDLEKRLFYLNPAGRELIGIGPKEDVRRFLMHDFYPPEELQTILKQALPTALTVGSWSGELRIIQKDGAIIPVEETISVNYDATQRPESFNITLRNISRRKAAEVERERLLAEVEAAYRRYVRQEWTQFLSEKGQWHIEHQLHSLGEVAPEALTRLREEVLHNPKTTALSGDGQAALVAPIALRGQVIGTLSLEDLAPHRRWTPDEIALVETISEQLALTLENTRLFEQTQQRAIREQLTRQIADKMHASPDITSIIQVGVQELAKVLGGSHTVVELSLEEEQ